MTTFLVTGANRGLGLEFVKQLSDRGDRVIATARDLDAASALRSAASASCQRVRLLSLDVTSPESVCQLAGSLADEAVDVLINNAGTMGPRTSVGSMDYESMEHCFRVNVMGTMRVTEAAIPALERGSLRHVVNMSSKMGSITDNSSGGAYGYRASKCALNMVTKSLSIDLGGRGFVCMSMHPGWVLTDMGGPAALIDAQTSVRAMLERIDGLSEAQTGSFFEWSGGEVAW